MRNPADVLQALLAASDNDGAVHQRDLADGILLLVQVSAGQVWCWLAAPAAHPLTRVAEDTLARALGVPAQALRTPDIGFQAREIAGQPYFVVCYIWQQERDCYA